MPSLDLRAKLLKLLDVEDLPLDERKTYAFVVTTVPEGSLEEAMYPEAAFHLAGRFEWYYRPNGKRRERNVRKAA